MVGHAVTIITLQAAVAVRSAPLHLSRAQRAGAAVAHVAGDVVNGFGRRGVGGGRGRGLAGMHERLKLYSGALTAGPTDTGGWRVRAQLPPEPDHIAA